MLKHVYKLYAEHGLDALWKWAMEPKTPRGKAKRFKVLAEFASRKRAKADKKDKPTWADRAHTYREEKKKYERRANRRHGDVPPVVDGGWHPDAKRVQISGGSGGFLSVPPKLVWHTTEGSSLPTYSGSAPHFTLNPKTGDLYQHVPITAAAFALLHPSGTAETNHAHALQVELIGFASQTQDWTDAMYANVAKLARWIEAHAGVERRCGVKFGGATNLPPRLSAQAWYAYKGHLGHQHVPAQSHWDPGALHIGKVI